MKQTDERYQQYIKVLKEELVAAMGCTEPVSIAYAAARARELLGAEPRHVLIEASGNIIKERQERDRSAYRRDEGDRGCGRGGHRGRRRFARLAGHRVHR